MDVELYRERPKYDAGFKAILALPAVAVGLVVYVAITQAKDESSVIVLGVVAFITLVIWAIMPRRYVIMDDRFRVLAGGPIAFTYHFRSIKSVTTCGGSSLTVNLATSVSRRRVVCILRRRGLGVAVTPNDRDAFVRVFNLALTSYGRSVQLAGSVG